MRRPNLQAGVVALVLALTSTSAFAADAEVRKISSAEDWSVFQTTLNGEPLCWATTRPFEMSKGTAELNPHISYAVGYDQLSVTLEGGKSPSLIGFLSVGPQEYPMLFRGSHGWLSNRLPDQVFEKAAGNQRFAYISVGANSFSFSLSGFYEAIGQARVACGLE
ncbi:MAG: hypothetical protein AAGH68_09185 [Pseudomonadota bacterium]